MSSLPSTPSRRIPLRTPVEELDDAVPTVSHSQSRSFSRLWERLAASPPFSALGVGGATTTTATTTTPQTTETANGDHASRRVSAVDAEPVVSRGAAAAAAVESSNVSIHGNPSSSSSAYTRHAQQPMSGSWTERTVPRWGYSKERDRERAWRLAGQDSHASSTYDFVSDDETDDDDGPRSFSIRPLDGDEGVHVDDEACFVDGWDGKVDFFSSLPHEVCLYILLHLDVETLLAVSTVCKSWRSLALDNVLWRDLFHRNLRWRVRSEHYTSDDTTKPKYVFPPHALPRLAPPVVPPMRRAAGSYSSRITPMKALASVSTSTPTMMTQNAASETRIARRLDDVTSEFGNLSLGAPSSTGVSNGDDSVPVGLQAGVSTPTRRTATLSLAGEPSTLTFPAHAYATPSVLSSTSRSNSSSALSSLASSLVLPGTPQSSRPAGGPAGSPAGVRRVSTATIPPVGPVPSPSLSMQPSAPLYLDWPQLYRDRFVLEQRWRRGEAKYTWLKGHTDSVYCIQFDENVVISGSRDQTIRIWDLRTGQCIKTLVTGHQGSVLCLQSDSRVLISGSSDSRVLVWDLVGEEGTGRGQYDVKMTLVGHHAGVLDLCLDDKWIASCSKDTTIKIWHKSNGELYRTLSGHRGPVNAVQLLNDQLVSASGDAVMKLWDVTTGDVLRVFTGHERGLACVKLSASGRLLASGSNDQTVKLWNVATGECVRTLTGHTDLVRSLAIDEQAGRVVSASYDRTTRVWDLATGDEVHKLKGHSSLVFDVAFSATKILSCSHDQRILVADFGSGLETDLFV